MRTLSNPLISFDPSASIFMAANAGSGKTSQLTWRVLSLLMHGVEPGKILCLTFTKGAAAEMRARIVGTLGRWVMMDEQALIRELSQFLPQPIATPMLARARSLFAAVLDAPVGLRLQTIHGFCQSLLAKFPIEAGVGTHLSVIDDTTQQALLKEARLQLFAHAGDAGNKEGHRLSLLVQQLGEFNLLKILQEAVTHKRKLTRFIDAYHGIGFATKAIYNALGISPEESFSGLVDKHLRRDAAHLAQLRRIAQVLQAKGGKTNEATASALTAWSYAQADEEALVAYRTEMLTLDGRVTKIFTKDVLSPADELLLAEEQQRLVTFSCAWFSLRDAQLTESLLGVADMLIRRYDALKEQHGFMDYDDQIIAASRLLSQSNMSAWVMYKLDGGIDHVLVDEAQDTSPEQWEIVRALTGEFFAGMGRSAQERSLFVVGDEKQSIFRFQGADPAGLATNRGYFLEKLSAAAMVAETVALTHSYRSAPEILTLVDKVFASEQARTGLTASGDVVTHQAKRATAQGYAELWPIAMNDPDKNHYAEAILARDVAKQIGQWIGQGITPGDIMVLTRRRRAQFIGPLIRALKQRKIPVAGVDRMDLLENIAVQDLLAFAQILLLPEDDLTLAALLKSPIFGISEEKLFSLCHDRKSSLWQALSRDESCRDAYALLVHFRGKVDFISAYQLYAELLDVRGMRRKITGRMGEEYHEVLDVFLEQCLAYEQSNIPSMQSFLAWFTSGETELKRDLEHQGDLVRIMTVHASKGLQARCVILADTTSTPDAKDRLHWYDVRGRHAVPIFTQESKEASPAMCTAKGVERTRELEEYRRLLYVALTRAEDVLLICGAAYKDGMQKGCWYELVQDAFTHIGRPLENGKMALGTFLVTPKEEPMPQPKIQALPLPGDAPSEENPPRPLSPSQLAAQEPQALSPLAGNMQLQRGVAMHRLMQYLPATPVAQRGMLADSIVRAQGEWLDEAARAQLIAQAFAVLESEQFGILFGPDSIAEVPISGMVEWKGKQVRVAGQIDRLVVRADEVWIVDFKSNAHVPEHAPEAYVQQLALYSAVVARIYPQKRLRAGLLWTSLPRLDWLAQGVLDEVPAESYI